MIKFIIQKDGTDVWISDRAITRLVRVGQFATQIWTIDGAVIVIGNADDVAKEIEKERRVYGN